MMKFHRLFALFFLVFCIDLSTQLSADDITSLFGTTVITNVKNADELNDFLKANEYLNYKDHFITRSYYSRSVIIQVTKSTCEEIPDYFFTRFPSAQSVLFAGIELKKIDPNALINAKNVKMIDFSNNSLTTLERKSFVNLLSAERIDLEYNKIESIDGVFDGASKFLKTVNLTFNKISEIPEGTFSTVFAMEDLDLRYNQIEKVGRIKMSQDGAGIARFHLSYNRIREFNTGFDMSIQELYLDNNELVSLPAVEKVRDLDVSNNKLRSLTLKNDVQQIKAYSNQLKSIDIGDNINLTYADLGLNDLDQKTVGRILNMPYLMYLDLTNSKVGPLNVTTFSAMTSLKTLILKNTQISNVEFGTFSHQINLEALDISDNKLMNIDLDKFSSLSNLAWLSLSGNMLKDINNSEHMKKVFPKLKEIGINDNDWSCSYLANMMKWFNHAEISILYNPPIVLTGPNIRGIGCVDLSSVNTGNIPSSFQPSLPDDYKNTIAQLLDAIKAQSSKQSAPIMIHNPEKLTSEQGSTNGTLVTFVCVAAVIVSIFYSIKLLMIVKNQFFYSSRGRSQSQAVLNPFNDTL